MNRPHPITCAVLLGLFALLASATQGPTFSSRTRLAGLTPQQEEILSHLSIVYYPDGQGGAVKTLRVTGLNLQLVNGLGATNGYPPDPVNTDPTMTQVNGLGNLILGYHETSGAFERTGSHNLVLGVDNHYASFAGIVAGTSNQLLGPFAAITTGSENLADAPYATVTGGYQNTASAGYGAVSGGSGRLVDGLFNWAAGSLFELD